MYFVVLFYVLLVQLRPSCPLFPYTTLFRSVVDGAAHPVAHHRPVAVGAEMGEGAPRLGARALLVLLDQRSEEHTSELQSRSDLVCRHLLEKKHGRDMCHDGLNELHSEGIPC